MSYPQYFARLWRCWLSRSIRVLVSAQQYSTRGSIRTSCTKDHDAHLLSLLLEYKNLRKFRVSASSGRREWPADRIWCWSRTTARELQCYLQSGPEEAKATVFIIPISKYTHGRYRLQRDIAAGHHRRILTIRKS